MKNIMTGNYLPDYNKTIDDVMMDPDGAITIRTAINNPNGRHMTIVIQAPNHLLSYSSLEMDDTFDGRTKKRFEFRIRTNFPLPREKETLTYIIDKSIIPVNMYKPGEGVYDYFLPFFPVAWMADIWPDLEQLLDPPKKGKVEGFLDNLFGGGKKKEKKEIGNNEPKMIEQHDDPNESLAHYALTHGCDYLDMSTMELYHHHQ